MSPEDRVRLSHIVESARLIESYVKGITQEEFSLDALRQDAVVRRIQIIGEATRHLSEEAVASIPNFEAQKVRGMHNILVHDYDGVNVDLVWKTARDKIPELFHAIDSYLRESS
jgi:uncharacterized protein with HEPN domain